MIDLASSAMAALAPYLPAIRANRVHASNDIAAQALYELVGTALRQIGAQVSWEAYLSDPSLETMIKRLLADSLNKNPDLAQHIDKAVTRVTNDYSTTNTNQSGAQVGRGGTMAGRDVTHKRTNNGGIIAVIAVIIVAAIAIVVGRAVYHSVNSGLTADSSCSQFLQAPQDEEVRAIRTIGIDEGVSGTGSPLALPAISYSCSGQPSARLGDVIASFRGQF